MTRYSRKKSNIGYKRFAKQCKTKRKTKDLDQIDQDLQPNNSEKLLNQEIDLDLPGCAQFYCLHCARHFIDNHALTEHFRTKVHKRRMKALEIEPYTIEESVAAAGMGNYTAPKRRKIVTQPLKGSD